MRRRRIRPVWRIPSLAAWLILAVTLVAAPAQGLDLEDTRHLLDRTGFGVRPADLSIFRPLTRSEAVARQLMPPTTEQPAPEWAEQRPFPDRRWLKTLPDAERRAWKTSYRQRRRDQWMELKAWWYRAMLTSDRPLTERMTLFWHNHFTSQLRAVRSPQLMWRQNALLRRHALGSYRELLRAIVTDPAMLIYLDGRRNHKRQPNENFARELLELFTLGEGHYTEADVVAAARALTGWTLDPASGDARLQSRRHDAGDKTLLGRSGPWGADAVVSILLEHPRTAELVVEKLWREFVSPQPDPAEVGRLSGLFRESGYEVRPLLRELLMSDAFWSAENRGSLIKSPVELIVGTLYRFDLPLPPDKQLISTGRRLGQDVLDPPDVKGWPGYLEWIDANRLIGRERFLRGVVRDLEDESALAGRSWSDLDTSVILRLLWPLSGSAAQPRVEESGVRRRLIAAILDPRYELK